MYKFQNLWRLKDLLTIWNSICGKIRPQFIELAVFKTTEWFFKSFFLSVWSDNKLLTILWQSSKFPSIPKTLTFGDSQVTICCLWILLIPSVGYMTNTPSRFLVLHIKLILHSNSKIVLICIFQILWKMKAFPSPLKKIYGSSNSAKICPKIGPKNWPYYSETALSESALFEDPRFWLEE